MQILNRLAIDRYGYVKWPVFWLEDLESINRCMDDEKWSRGKSIEAFETAFSSFCDCRNTLLVSSGTEALKIALDASGINSGDEVILPGLTWPSTALAVLECGASPVIVDVEEDTFGISPEAVERNISDKTRAIIAVHLYNSTADIDSLNRIAKKNNLLLFEDAAQVHGGRWKNRQLGTLGDAGIFSFQQKKLMTCGEGGCLVTNDDRVYERAYALRDHGATWRQAQSKRYGGNSRVPTISAVVLMSQLQRLPAILELEEKNGIRLGEALDEVEGLECLRRRERVSLQTSYNFCFQLKSDRLLEQKREILRYLSRSLNMRFETSYPPLSEKKFFNPDLEKRFRGLCRFDDLSNCYGANERSVRFHHRYLLGPWENLERLVEEIKHVAEPDLKCMI